MISKFYSRWFQAFYPDALAEPGLDCANCLMVKPPPKTPRRDEGPFSNDLKCCTYLPFTTNVALGSRELHESSGWDVRWATAVKRGVLTPLGLIPPDSEADRDGFGQDPKRICPFFDRGSCTIWSARSAVCSNYVCISGAGEEGLTFWAESEELGNRLEWALSHLVLWRLGFTTDETTEMAEAARLGDRKRAEATFGEWRGREQDLFDRCRNVAQAIETEDLLEILGDDEELLMVSLAKRRDELGP